MATFTKFNCFVENVAEKVHNLGSDTLKIMLSNSAPNVSTNTVLADITEISTGSGYSAGGTAVTITASSQTRPGPQARSPRRTSGTSTSSNDASRAPSRLHRAGISATTFRSTSAHEA